MTEIWSTAALWIGLGLAAALLAARLRLASPLVELVLGMAAQGALVFLGLGDLPGLDQSWLAVLAGFGAVMLTFLAGAELDPAALRCTWKEAGLLGAASFSVPLVLCTAAAWGLLDWSVEASLLAGVALSETSVAIVHAWMLQSERNTSLYGKTILAACFIADLGTVLALGLFFAPAGGRTLLLGMAAAGGALLLPPLARRLKAGFEGHAAEPEARFLLLALLGVGALALWAGSPAVLPAYVIGIALAGTVGRDATLVRRLRTLTFGLLTPFYFLRAGALVSLPAVLAAPAAVLVLVAAKLWSKALGVYPCARWHWRHRAYAGQTTLLMSTGLTFGSICALYGVEHGIIDRGQYSLLLAAILTSAVVPMAVSALAPGNRLKAGESGADTH